MAMLPLTYSIISHGHGFELARLLKFLDNIDDLKGLNVIVTMNKLEDIANFKEFKNIRIIVIRNKVPLGFGENHNNAFLLCKTKFFCILNPDIVISDPDVFRELIKILEYDHQIVLVAPEILNDRMDIEDSVRENLTIFSLIKRYFLDRKIVNYPHKIFEINKKFFWIAGMFYIVNSNTFRDIGGFNRRYFLYCEDYDLCARIFLAGKKYTISDKSFVIHNGHRDSHKSYRYLLLHLVSLIKVWFSCVFLKIFINDFKSQ
jgi:GT2 family glycosyltransferase